MPPGALRSLNSGSKDHIAREHTELVSLAHGAKARGALAGPAETPAGSATDVAFYADWWLRRNKPSE
jgi:hypothetical protein